MGKRHWLQFVSNGILALFLGIIVIVIVVAYTRRSGSTGLDMASIHKLRHDAVQLDTVSSLPVHAP